MGKRIGVLAAKVVAVCATVACVGVVVDGSRADAAEFRPGAPDLGDPLLPGGGNGGYQVDHYDLGIDYYPTGRVDGVAALTARTTQDLSRFTLDLRGLDVTTVTVNGTRADFQRDGQELVVTPGRGLRDGSRFAVVVTYGGVPQPLGGEQPYGWVATESGAVTANGLDGASTWFPANDHPSDKATFTFRVTVPADRGVVANGELASREVSGDTATYVWRERAPMAPHLATVDIGRWEIRKGRTPGGVPSYVAVDPKLHGQADYFWTTTAQVVDLWSATFGPYPFGSTGAIGVYAEHGGNQLPISQEAQTRPVYSQAESTELIAHELAHQWFGDSVGLTRVSDIWLSEGFATFAAWYWTEHGGGLSAHDQARQIYEKYPADSPVWQVVLTDPKRLDQNSGPKIYEVGALTLQLLRERLGDERFFTLLRTWTTEHRHGTATTADFVACANRIAGEDLTGFLQPWLTGTTRPPLP
jgi:aminopeptidase N